MKKGQLGLHLSIATATFYYLPFEEALEIIAEAGFQWVELDMYWENQNWVVAQHLRDWAPLDTVRAIEQAGLKISSIHDAGGVMNDETSIRGFVNHQLSEYLNHLGYSPANIVFHVPHIQLSLSLNWWRRISSKIARAASAYINGNTGVTIENVSLVAGYYIPLVTPEDLLDFVDGTQLGVTMDTSHYAQYAVDVIQAAATLKTKIRTIHLSDYAEGRSHVLIGEGLIDFAQLFRTLHLPALSSITLECSVSQLSNFQPPSMKKQILVKMLRLAKERTERFIEEARCAQESNPL